MAIWKDIVAKDSTQPEMAAGTPPSPPPPVNRLRPEAVQSAPTLPPVAAARKDLKESVIATGLTFEGKIEGSGHVRISGRFKGDVHVDGTLTVELRLRAGRTDRLELLGADGKVLARGLWSGTSAKRLAFVVCGQRSLRVRVTLGGSAGAFALSIARP